ncbi:Xaa-Pro aminopeptidase ApepP [Araneus ventricosus]|uniref:Xaa-Pro aminopeptidase ApepP n=1 Tax=Araneus ventricosus TaxID=182803 RepID=A0A4Y2MNX4_ARAVE|nr:Xaa-Pro aminopeptidase ApepP [Araneus ventricosus]
MKASGYDAYIVPSIDEHQSKMMTDHDKRREFISGFTGSSGTAVILSELAALWTDGRYFIQAEQELDCNWILMKRYEPGVPEPDDWIIQVLGAGGNVGVDPKLLPYNVWMTLKEKLTHKGLNLMEDSSNLIDDIWNIPQGRAPESISHVFIHDVKVYQYRGYKLSGQIEYTYHIPVRKCSIHITSMCGWRRTRAAQEQFSVNVWAGMVGDHLVGPYLLPKRLTGANYLIFLQQNLLQLLDDVRVSTAMRSSMGFQHDGAPAHYSIDMRLHLNATHGQQWIGRGSPVLWPARSADLTCLDNFLWGCIKSLVYETPVNSAEDLVACIADSCWGRQPWEDKVKKLREILNDNGANGTVVTALDEIAWLFNLRGNDIADTPLFKAYSFISTNQIRLYIRPLKLTPEVEKHLCPNLNNSECVKLEDYVYAFGDMKKVIPESGKILVSSSSSYAVVNLVPELMTYAYQIYPMYSVIVKVCNYVAFVYFRSFIDEGEAVETNYLKNGSRVVWLQLLSPGANFQHAALPLQVS